VAFAFSANWVFGANGLTAPMLAVAFLPLVQTQEDVAATALLLRGRYDVRAAFLTLSMALRLVGIAVGAHYGVLEAVLGMIAAQVVATGAVAAAGVAAFRRFPSAPSRPFDEDRKEVSAFVVQSSIATGVLSLRTMLAPLLLGVAAGTTAIGLFRVAQAPQSGLTAASSPVRLILLTEQTRDWEYGRERTVLTGVRRFTFAAAALMAVVVPVFYWAMPDLVRLVFGAQYLPAATAARIMLFAAALQFVYGWSKSLPVSIGKPQLRVWAHGLEAAVLLPLVVVFGWKWGVNGAAIAMLVSTGAFVGLWSVFLVRLRGEVAGRAAVA
jgi:O-antigen/teichoic acid export membrane protein